MKFFLSLLFKFKSLNSATLFDVQTEYLYGLAEATTEISKKENIWKESQEVDNMKIAAEKESFEKLMQKIIEMWKDIYKEYNK